MGLASLSGPTDDDEGIAGLDYCDCNYLGGDLSQATIRYATGMAERLNLSEKLQITHASAKNLLDQVSFLYPGRVALVMIQFPTPYRLANTTGKVDGNSQLPSGSDSPDFMVSQSVMEQIAIMLKRSAGDLLLQTNCEDVAISLRDRAMSCGFECVLATNPVVSRFSCASGEENHCGDHYRLPERTQNWIRLGGQRAVGLEWSSEPLLPMRCATETEVACQIQGTPIHRCLLTMKH